MNRTSWLGLFLMIVATCAYGQSDCQVEKEKFRELNLPLVVETKEDRLAYTPEREQLLTKRLHGFVSQQIVLHLGKKLKTMDLDSFIQCMQSGLPMYGKMRGLGNVPLVVRLPQKQSIAVAYSFFRGGLGVPEIRNYFEIYRYGEGSWHVVGGAGLELGSSTFFVYPLAAGRAGEDWFLLSGKPYGDTRGRLRLVVVAYDGQRVRTVWQSPWLPWTTLERVSGDRVVLTGTAQDEKGKAFEFTRLLEVQATGLKETKMEKRPITP